MSKYTIEDKYKLLCFLLKVTIAGPIGRCNAGLLEMEPVHFEFKSLPDTVEELLDLLLDKEEEIKSNVERYRKMTIR